MARTVLTTGIALKAFFIFGVDDDGVVKVFKSVNSSAADNTSSVQADMTVSGTLTYGDISWPGGDSGVGKTLKGVRSNGTSYVQFGTNKPYCIDSMSFTNGILMVYSGNAIGSAGAHGFATRDSGGRIPEPNAFTGDKQGCFALGTQLGYSSASFTAGT